MPESSAVRQLREEPVEKVVASGVNIVVSLPEGRQISFSTGFEGDETDAVVNARFDRVFRLADRQRARYEIAELEEDLKRHQLANVRMHKDRDDIEKQYEVDQAQRQVQVDTIRRDGDARAVATGRRGDYKPQGASKVTLERLQAAIAAARNEIEVGRTNFAETIKRHSEETEACEAKLAKARKLAEG